MKAIFHRYPREVAFSETDASGWVHFTKAPIYAGGRLLLEGEE